MTRLADLTTLRVGGPAGSFVEAGTEAELIQVVRDADAAGTPVLVLGGGSNLLVSDAGFDGLVVRDARASVDVVDDGTCGGASITVSAGTPWDSVVERATVDGWVGIEALSGIPGSTGATPVQNVGAYGAEVSQVIANVRTWDRAQGRVRTLARVDCGFAYRDSVFKRTMRGAGVSIGADAPAVDGRAWQPSPRFVVLDVTMQMRWGTLSGFITYPQLAAALGIAVGERAPIADVRAAVLEVRGSKGMVLNDADRDTWSAGSFFTNPVLSADAAAGLPADAPRFPVAAGESTDVKTSAAWLIEQAGFGRGFALDGSHASLSTKHTLALSNRGDASAAEILDLARAIRDGVRDRFGVELVPEPVFVGLQL